MTAHDEYKRLHQSAMDAYAICDRTYSSIGRLHAQGKPVPSGLIMLAAERDDVWRRALDESEAFFRANFPEEASA